MESGSYQFQFAALGAVVVSIGTGQQVSSVSWSCDEGDSWSDVEFLDRSNRASIRVVGMLTERGEKALHVTYVGGIGF